MVKRFEDKKNEEELFPSDKEADVIVEEEEPEQPIPLPIFDVPKGWRIQIYRILPSGRPAYLKSIDYQTTLDEIKEDFGGGRFKFQLVDDRNRICKIKTIEIEGAPKLTMIDKLNPSVTSELTTETDDPMDRLLMKFEKQIERRMKWQMLQQMLNQNSGQPDMQQMFQAWLQKELNKDHTTEMLKTLEAINTLKEAAGVNTDLNKPWWVDTIIQVLPEAFDTIKEVMKPEKHNQQTTLPQQPTQQTTLPQQPTQQTTPEIPAQYEPLLTIIPKLAYAIQVNFPVKSAVAMVDNFENEKISGAQFHDWLMQSSITTEYITDIIKQFRNHPKLLKYQKHIDIILSPKGQSWITAYLDEVANLYTEEQSLEEEDVNNSRLQPSWNTNKEETFISNESIPTNDTGRLNQSDSGTSSKRDKSKKSASSDSSPKLD